MHVIFLCFRDSFYEFFCNYDKHVKRHLGEILITDFKKSTCVLFNLKAEIWYLIYKVAYFTCTRLQLIIYYHFKDGVHQEKEEAEPVHTEAELKLMFSQDQKYVTMKRTSELNVSQFNSGLHILPPLLTINFSSFS